MSRLPDRFDLLVRKVRDTGMAPDRQLDLLLAALFTVKEAHLINAGTEAEPRPSFVELDGEILMPVFSSVDQADTYSSERGQRGDRDALGLISMPPPLLLEVSRLFTDSGCHHWFVNPGPYGFILPLHEVESYESQRAQAQASAHTGFWIPNLTSEEEAFWEDHGL
ncbi:MAG: hypothetical protein HC904_01790 [Blastochloris sp.]|nr:hypothetical protein [Blastochloris sp.]